MQVTLTAIAGPHQGQSYTFDQHDIFLVGRSGKAHFRLPRKDMYFSRVHFMVEVNPPRIALLDLGSRNGTRVNGQRVESANLRHGDEIQAGHTVLRVAIATTESSEALPVAVQGEPADPSLPTIATMVPEERVFKLPPNLCAACEGPRLPEQKLLCATCDEQAAEHFQPVPGHVLVQELGRGAMGVVYLGVRESDGLRVAVKTIQPAIASDQQQVQRFLREAEILRQLHHPNIVTFREMGEAAGMLYFVMDHIRGTDAKQLLKKRGALEVRLAVRIMCQVLEAVAHAHERGFVHRDIKPANIILAQEAGRKTVKLADFGLARVYQASQLSGVTMNGDVGGTLPYLAPEQITNYRDVRPTADQYSAAATLYNLLTNQYVYDFPARTVAGFMLIMEKEPVPILERCPDLPEPLARAIHRALAREPKERYATVNAFRKALISFGR